MDKKELYESMLFNYETVNRTDFQTTKLESLVKTRYKGKPGHAARPQPIYKNVHTLTEWKKKVPFDLMYKPKEIVREDPRIVQQAYVKPIDYERELAQRTRPRLVMTPAVSMDDIDDGAARQVLCRDMYTSTVMKANAEGAPKCANVGVPFPGLPARAQPITLEAVRPPRVPPEWRYDSITWDGKQVRSYADPTKEFWMQRTPECRVCDATAIREQKRKETLQMKGGAI